MQCKCLQMNAKLQKSRAVTSEVSFARAELEKTSIMHFK